MKHLQAHDTAQDCFLKCGPLISVVVPIYNMEKLLPCCLDSILSQTYENLEIILVDDCSTDDSAKIIQQYVDQDERIKTVHHKKNQGLFQARISGADIASGKYIAFVDSDDYLSMDWFRLLLKRAERDSADIVVGEWCYDHGDRREYCNLDHFRFQEYCLSGDKVLAAFMEQEGRNYSWWVMWNKLYTKTLWDQCAPAFRRFSKEHGHMLMWEDVAFSSGLWSHAKKMTNVHGANYYYVQHQAASTALSKKRPRILKYISDASAALSFMKEQLISVGKYAAFEVYYTNWKQRGISIVYHDIVTDLGLSRMEGTIRKEFDFHGEFSKRDIFFYKMTTTLQASFAWLEDIKRKIVSSQIRYVSFDIFDTLVLRPFFHPTDLFSLLSDEINKDSSAFIDFAQIRVDAERNCRKEIERRFPSREEITLDEIYDTIAQNYAFDNKTIRALEAHEKALELEFTRTRKIGKELYELAQDAGKDIIICSDMYLPQETVTDILHKNGYIDYKKLYLSSEIQRTKATKNLYAFVKKDLKCNWKGAILHIGDNWASDIENAAASGFETGHLSKPVDILQNSNPGIYSGDAFSNIFVRNSSREDYRLDLDGYVGLRCAVAFVANRFFDNPYVSFNSWSDFNGDPNYIGYFALGPHLLALAHWLVNCAEQRHIPTIHFVARDGYMVKKAFDIVNQTETKSSYIRLSRRALVLADVNRGEDLYSLYGKINVLATSPKELQKYLDPIIPPTAKDSLQELISDNGFFFDRKFKTVSEYERCLKLYIQKIVDFSLLPAYKEKLYAYFSQIIKPGDYIFDVGYSGRPEAALSNILGTPVGSLYIHVNSEVAKQRQQKYHCPSECFYDFKPSITGVMREHLLMELGPSTIGFEEVDGKLRPQFEEYRPDYETTLITSLVQQAAYEFVSDYQRTFQDRLILPLDALSAPFEYYLHYSKSFDRQIFSAGNFEDALGEGRTFNAVEFWDQDIMAHGLAPKGSAQLMVPAEFSDIYLDGLFVKFYRAMNKWFPKGGWGREIVKKIVSLFIH